MARYARLNLPGEGLRRRRTNKGERGSPSVTTAWRRKAPPLLLDHHNPLPGSLSPGLKPD